MSCLTHSTTSIITLITIHLPVPLYVLLFTYLSLLLFTYLSLCMSCFSPTCPSVCPAFHLPVPLHVLLFTYLSLSMSCFSPTCPSQCPAFHLPVSLNVLLFTYLSLSMSCLTRSRALRSSSFSFFSCSRTSCSSRSCWNCFSCCTLCPVLRRSISFSRSFCNQQQPSQRWEEEDEHTPSLNSQHPFHLLIINLPKSLLYVSCCLSTEITSVSFMLSTPCVCLPKSPLWASCSPPFPPTSVY